MYKAVSLLLNLAVDCVSRQAEALLDEAIAFWHTPDLPFFSTTNLILITANPFEPACEPGQHAALSSLCKKNEFHQPCILVRQSALPVHYNGSTTCL